MDLYMETQNESDPNMLSWVKDNCRGLCTRFGRLKHHMAKTETVKNFIAVQQNGRTVPIYQHE